MLNWSKTRGAPQHNASTHESVLCEQTYHGSKQQEKGASICSTIIWTCIILPLLPLYLRRVWTIRNRYHGTYVNTSYTCQYREMQQSFGRGHEYRTFPYNSGRSGTLCEKSSYESSARPFVSLNSRCGSMTMTREWDRTATLRRWWCSHPPILWSRRCHAVAACMFVSWSSKIDSACFGKINTRKKTKKYRCKIRRDNIRR